MRWETENLQTLLAELMSDIMTQRLHKRADTLKVEDRDVSYEELMSDGYIALEFPSEGCSPSPHLMGSADEDKTEYVVKMPPLTFLRHFRQIEDASRLPSEHSILSDFSAYYDSFRANNERSDCGIIVLKLTMLRLAGHTEVPLHWLLPLTEQQKLKYESCAIQVPTARFVMQHAHRHITSAADFASEFPALCACVGTGNEAAPDWWLVLSLARAVAEKENIVIAGESKSSKHFGIGSVSHQTITQGRNKIWSGLEEQFHVLFVFVTESMVPKTSRGFASDVVIVDASNLDKYASPVTIDIRRVGSHDRKRPRST